VTSSPSTADVALAAAPALTMTKSAVVTDRNSDFQIDLGDTISWSFKVENTGNVTIHGIAVSDVMAGSVTCPATALAPGDNVICTADADHTIDQADVDAGVVSNTASGSGLDPDGTVVPSNSSSTDTPVAQGSGLTATKLATVTDVDHDGKTDLGDSINYSVQVHNSGHVTLHGVSIADALAGPMTCPATSLPPGGDLTCTAATPYTITQADVDAGHVDNTATAHAIAPGGATVDAPPSSVSTVINATSSLLLVKHAAIADTHADGHRGVGDTITWTFTLTNSGTRSVTGVSVDDPTAGSVTCLATSLAPGASTTCTADATHVVTQADVDAGVVSNTASADGTNSLGDPVTSNGSSTDTALDQISGLTLTKRGQPTDVNGDGLIGVGDTIAWTFTVTNSGLVTLTNVAVTDTKAGSVTCQATTLAPGDTTTCAADEPYTITAADAASGGVHNQATVNADCGCGTAVLGVKAAAVVAADPSTVPSVSPSGSGSGLPFTGAQAVPELIAVGLVATLLGTFLLLVGARRRT
jgi:uncharacterized repeat protein (TIGR01451 family)